jgi:hypothetical protein
VALKPWVLALQNNHCSGLFMVKWVVQAQVFGELIRTVNSKERHMHLQIVMDSNGDTRHEFDPTDLSSLATAEARFQELTGKGFRAVALGKDGAPGELMRKFDHRAEQTLFMPQLQGG